MRIVIKRSLLLAIFVGSLSFSNTLYASAFKGLLEDILIGQIEGVKLSINIAFPDSKSEEPRGVLLFIHGGGFKSGDKKDKNAQIQRFAKRGFVAASAMYRLSPDHRFPAQIEDIKLAIRFLKSNANQYHINPQRIIVTGASAGSYLAVMAGVTGNADGFSKHGLYTEYDSSVRAVAAQSAPIADFSAPQYHNSLTVQRLAPLNADNLVEVLLAMSPVTYLDSQDPPFFLSHGDADPIVPVTMSRDFAKELQKRQHNFEYHEVKGGTHSLNRSTPQQAKQVYAKYLEFINKWTQ
ncbi:alpha/beta hydrolase [Paraglaciecola hydrolytica]|uniref:BD-FAE-like domain-containing protein n=1 Tax=Paraglaciecola hydrolytica TaxID=1799789 RepID=A0A148KMC0_9ALTE|nr:alpha/beta hydrolase [Paraglaciecola hydrolytica]KXI27456.1 hypothetical protein AX660_22335 [Paraglaciecola hydrolytica]